VCSPDFIAQVMGRAWRPGVLEGRVELVLKQIAEAVGLACELATVMVVALGAITTIARAILDFPRLAQPSVKKALWVGFAGWILLALEFALAADIARSAITPSWDDIARLAAIAAIRTILNLFLERDIEASARRETANTSG
jgi:uncharacterized membrane protein